MIRLQMWLFRHFTVGMLTALFRRFGQSAKEDAAREAAAVAVDPVRMACLEAIFSTALGFSRRREGLDNDFQGIRPLELDSISCPTLIMHARADASVPSANAEYAHSRIPDSELYWMRGSHVSFYLEDALTAQPYALDWLKRDGEGSP